MGFEDTKETLELRKIVFECKQKNSYGIENRNDMIHIHEKEVNEIAEYNLVKDIINPPKRANSVDIQYSPMLHGCMNTRHGRVKFQKF